MPTILDNRSKIKKLDSQNMLGSLELLGEQVKQMCKQKVTLPASYRKVKNVVVLGMGGSTLGSHVIKALYANTLTVPVDIINGYHVPASVSEHTLVIVSSYSGTTEEPVAAGKEALAKKAKVLTISSGGTLKTWALKNKLPAILFTTENNPCGSPRMGLGYSIVGQLLIFAAAGLISLSEKESKIILTTIAKYQALFGVDVPSRYNFAKGLALASVGKQFGMRRAITWPEAFILERIR
jgi:glucose/mannose-6-phosphate isomerase